MPSSYYWIIGQGEVGYSMIWDEVSSLRLGAPGRHGRRRQTMMPSYFVKLSMRDYYPSQKEWIKMRKTQKPKKRRKY